MHGEELYDLYCSINIILMMKSRRWPIEERGKVHAMSGWEHLRERDNWEGMGADGKILEWSSRDRLERRGLDCSGSG